MQNKAKFELKCPKGTRDFNPKQMSIRRWVMDIIVSIFKRHGAVEIDTPVFELKEVLMGKYGEDSKLIYDLKDQGGEECSLRYDLTVPFARFMAMNTDIKKIKRFHIGKVYRRDQPATTKGRFRQFYQCDFDIAGKYDSMIPDAEVLAIMQEILHELSINDFSVKVNHRKLLEAIVSHAGCPLDMFKTICSSIDKLDKQSWETVEEELLKKGANHAHTQIIRKFINFKGKPFEILKAVEESDVFKGNEAIGKVLEDMRTIFTYLQAMGCLDKVCFDFSLARGLDYYTGLIYEIVLLDKEKDLGAISGGGRYDDLIGMFSQQQIPAVGGSMGIERLFSILETRQAAEIRANQCDVFVAAVGNINPSNRLSLLSKLWKSGINAETSYTQNSKSGKQMDHIIKNQIPLVIWLGEEESKQNKVKFKNMSTHQEILIDEGSAVQNVLAALEELKKNAHKEV